MKFSPPVFTEGADGFHWCSALHTPGVKGQITDEVDAVKCSTYFLVIPVFMSNPSALGTKTRVCRIIHVYMYMYIHYYNIHTYSQNVHHTCNCKNTMYIVHAILYIHTHSHRKQKMSYMHYYA